MTTTEPVTELLNDVKALDFTARAELFAASQEELHALARRHMAGQRERNTWQTTALLNEAYLRMCSGRGGDALDIEHFMNLTSRVMRQILVDHARLRGAAKRGGGTRRVALDSIVDEYESRTNQELVEVSAGLDRLAKQDPETVRFVQLHFFGGLTQHEAATVLGWSERTARRRWNVAKLFLLRELAQ